MDIFEENYITQLSNIKDLEYIQYFKYVSSPQMY